MRRICVERIVKVHREPVNEAGRVLCGLIAVVAVVFLVWLLF